MSRARGFRKRIEIWQANSVKDGFGGYLIGDELIASSWAKVETFSSKSSYYKNLSLDGINDTQSALLFTFRKRNDLEYNSVNQFLMYRGLKYIISTNPNNENVDDSFIQFIGVRQATKTINQITPIGGDKFNYTFNFILESKVVVVNKIVDKYTERVIATGGVVSSEVCLAEYVNKIIN